MAEWAPDVLAALVDAGAHTQHLARKLRGIIEWALRRAVAAEPPIEIRAGTRITGLLAEKRNGARRAAGVRLDGGEPGATRLTPPSYANQTLPSGPAVTE